MNTSKRTSRILAAVLALVLGVGLAQAAAISASAAVCQGYVDKAGTSQPYTAPDSSWTKGTPFYCSVSSGIGSVGHKGQDYYKGGGNNVKAVATGVVRERGWEYTSSSEATLGCHGKYIVIEDSQGVFSIYAHLSTIDSAYPVGSTITRGDVLGVTGSTGSASACGVSSIGDHFELMLSYTWTVSSWGQGFEDASTKYTDPLVYMAHH
jgi:murein DD-endopeptidase MepM/ murein hydrolase activator NlpD